MHKNKIFKFLTTQQPGKTKKIAERKSPNYLY